MTDILGAMLTSNTPRCIGCGAPATVHDEPFKLCKRCDENLTASLRASGFPEITPVVPSTPVQS